MLITHMGHSEFLLQIGKTAILTDPFDDHVGYRMQSPAADVVLVSHSHGDHSCVQKVAGEPVVVTAPGVHSVAPGVTVTGIASVHDQEGGAKRGPNVIYVIEAEGLRVAHLGDQGCLLTAEQIARLGRVDVLLVPVGGFFTIDAAEAYETVKALSPAVTIPMHYKTAVNAAWPIQDESEFLRLMQAENCPRMPQIRITAGDLSQQPRCAVLRSVCL